MHGFAELVRRALEVAGVVEDQTVGAARRQQLQPVADEELHVLEPLQPRGSDRRTLGIPLDGHHAQCGLCHGLGPGSESGSRLGDPPPRGEHGEQPLDLGYRRAAAGHCLPPLLRRRARLGRGP